MPGRSRRTTRYRRDNRRNSLLVCLAIVTLAFVVVAVFLLLEMQLDQSRIPLPVVEGFDPAAVPGSLSEEKAGNINTIDTFDYRINSEITVSKGVANLRIENPVENRQLMKVTITLEDGTQAYATDFIRPYYCIETDKLDAVPEAGTYQVSARIEVYDRLDQEKVGEVIVPVTLTVE